MPPKRQKVTKKVEHQWTEQDMKDALHHMNSTPGATIRGTANRFGIGESTLRFRLKRNPNDPLGKAGRKCVFNEETEKELAECIAVVCNCGFSPSMEELRVSYTYYSYSLKAL
ncbi:MAG: hypothetical protein AAF549_09725 [Pseudomonadota bacterium]